MFLTFTTRPSDHWNATIGTLIYEVQVLSMCPCLYSPLHLSQSPAFALSSLSPFRDGHDIGFPRCQDASRRPGGIDKGHASPPSCGGCKSKIEVLPTSLGSPGASVLGLQVLTSHHILTCLSSVCTFLVCLSVQCFSCRKDIR